MKKDKNTERRYYVNGRWYSPELSIPLCRNIEIFEQTTLYQSPNGAFFTLRELNNKPPDEIHERYRTAFDENDV